MTKSGAKKSIAMLITGILMVSTLMMICGFRTCRAVSIIETVYIQADGSVTPVGAPITRNGDIYTLTENITTDAPYKGIWILRNNMTLNGNGYTLQGLGNTAAGVFLQDATNVTIKNINIKSFLDGIFLPTCSACNIVESNITSNSECGIWAESYSASNTIIKNTIAENGEGIRLHTSANYNSISSNNITGNVYGISVVYCFYNELKNNTITANTQSGIYIWYSSGNNNLIENTVTSNAMNGVYLDSAINNTLSDNNVTLNPTGIQISGSSNNTLTGNYLAHNQNGINFASSFNNTISRNAVVNNNGDGISIGNSADNNFHANNISENAFSGVYMTNSNNTFIENKIARNNWGIYADAGSNSVTYHNNFIDNSVQAYARDSANVWDNGWGPWWSSGGNFWGDYTGDDGNGDGYGDTPYVIDASNIDHYPFIALGQLREDLAVTSADTSKNGCTPKPTVCQGYSTNITATVENHGTFTETFTITYCLAIPTAEQFNTFWSMGDVNRDGYIDSTDASIIQANFGWIGPPGTNPADINSDGTVNMEDAAICSSNRGRDIFHYFSFNMPFEFIIGTQTVENLAHNSAITLTFVWNTAQTPHGVYAVYAYTEPAPVELEVADNALAAGIISITHQGDVNGDHVVDIFDCATIGLAFGAKPGDTNWNKNADIQESALIDIFDIVVVALHFGEPEP